MLKANTFGEVLYLGEDEAIVRILLKKYVPNEIGAIIVDEYNKHVDKYNAIKGIAPDKKSETASDE